MNVLYHFRTRGFGAEAVHISGIADALEEAGHRVVFCSPTGIDPRQNARAASYQETAHRGLFATIAKHAPAVVFELLELAYNFIAYGKLKRMLAANQIGLIYERHAFFLFITSLLAKRRGIPMIVEVNELVGDPRVRAQPFLKAVVRRCDRTVFQRADLIIVVSPHLKRRVEALGISGDKVLVLPNGVNRSEAERQHDGTGVREKLGLAGKTVVGFVGWLGPWHRIEMLVEAVASLAAANPDLHLLLVGEGELHDKLVALAAELGIPDRISFTGGVGRADIPSHIAAMDICVVPHSNEYRSPIKLFEYMANGRPVVAPETEPIAMVIESGRNGVLFPPGERQSLTGKLQELIQSPDLRMKIGTAAREDVLNRYTWERNVEEMLRRLQPRKDAP